MRTAIAGLILAAGFAASAQAQTAAPAGPAAAAPEAAAPAAPSAAEAPPTLPTSGDGAQIIQALEKVCMPAVAGKGGALDAAAKAAGLKGNRREGTWTMPLGGAKDYVIVFQPQFSQANICQAEVHYAVGQDAPIASALNIWAFLQQPKLTLAANYVNVDADGVKRVRKSWEHYEANGSGRAVNFSVWRKPDDTPLNPRFDTGMLVYQERK